MHFWNRELINHSRLHNDHQRYRFALASLRLGKTQQSRQTIKEGSLVFQHELRTKLLTIELDIKDRKIDEAKNALRHTQRLCHISKEHSIQWQQLSERCNPSPNQQSIIQPKNMVEWQRTLSLQKNNPELTLNYLKWANHLQPNQSQNIFENLSSLTKFSSYQLYQVFDTLKNNPVHWEQLIESILSIATLRNKEPEKMWRSWIKHCPSSHKNQLQHKMKTILLKHPNWKLEELLIQSSKELNQN
jgi:hypothetical protein